MLVTVSWSYQYALPLTRCEDSSATRTVSSMRWYLEVRVDVFAWNIPSSALGTRIRTTYGASSSKAAVS